MREYFTPQRSVFPSYLTVESGRMHYILMNDEVQIRMTQCCK